MGDRDEKILHQIGEEYPITICICQCWIAHFVESILSFTLLHSNALILTPWNLNMTIYSWKVLLLFCWSWNIDDKVSNILPMIFIQKELSEITKRQDKDIHRISPNNKIIGAKVKIMGLTNKRILKISFHICSECFSKQFSLGIKQVLFGWGVSGARQNPNIQMLTLGKH